ncbi:MAG: type II secretion system protein [Candidatus Omnitrophica bacterium]|nr:type II secretion system protein [Candidatus Omnitrophota bacterium]
MCCKVGGRKSSKEINCRCCPQKAKGIFANQFSFFHFLSKKKLQAFTIAELLIVVGILAVVIVGMINLFIYTSVAAALAGNKTVAVAAAQSKMEEIRNYDYDLIAVDYASGGVPGNTFLLNQPNGIGTIYIDSTNPDLLEIKIVVCWEDKYNRIIGEDINLNGNLEVDEDLNGNNELDSIVSLVMLFAKK